MKLNFESKEHRKDFFNYLKNKKVPLKYAFSGSATFTHDKLASKDTYHHAVSGKVDQYNFIGESFKNKKVTLIEIGPGNGIASIDLIRSLRNRSINIEEYIGIDFSKNLMKICGERIKKTFPDLKLSFFQSDFEEKIENNKVKEIFKKNRSNLVFMIGNTLGNVEDPQKMLFNIASLLKSGDCFIIGVSLKNNQDYDYIKDYLNQTFYDACLEPFKMAGIYNIKDKLEITFDKTIPAILGFYYPWKDLRVKEGNISFTIKLNSKIRCFMSRRFTVKILNNLLTNAGFKVLNNKIAKDSNAVISASVKN